MATPKDLEFGNSIQIEGVPNLVRGRALGIYDTRDDLLNESSRLTST